MKKLIQKGKPSTQSTVDDCMEGWDLSGIEIEDDDNNDNNDNNDNKDNKDNNDNKDEEKKNEF